MHKFILLFFIYLGSLSLSQAMDSTYLFQKKHNLGIEGLGVGRYGSLNYECLVLQGQRVKFTVRGGISFARFVNFENKFKPDIFVPISFNTILGGRKLWAEYGLGPVYTSYLVFNASKGESERVRELNLSTHLGVRYQKPEANWMYRLAVYEILDDFELTRFTVGLTIARRF